MSKLVTQVKRGATLVEVLGQAPTVDLAGYPDALIWLHGGRFATRAEARDSRAWQLSAPARALEVFTAACDPDGHVIGVEHRARKREDRASRRAVGASCAPVGKEAPKVIAARPCPHCGNSPLSFRMLADDVMLVCGGCGRSFVLC